MLGGFLNQKACSFQKKDTASHNAEYMFKVYVMSSTIANLFEFILNSV